MSTASHAIVNLEDAEDMAARHGLSEFHEARFPTAALGAEQTGLSHQRIHPGRRQPFAHHHRTAEEIYVVVSGSGRVKLDDEVAELRTRDALRIAPQVTRAFEAGPEGLELLVFGPRAEDDTVMVRDFWTD